MIQIWRRRRREKRKDRATDGLREGCRVVDVCRGLPAGQELLDHSLTNPGLLGQSADRERFPSAGELHEVLEDWNAAQGPASACTSAHDSPGWCGLFA